jgi:hypothetical protein
VGFVTKVLKEILGAEFLDVATCTGLGTRLESKGLSNR